MKYYYVLLLCVVCIHNSVEMGAISPALGTVNIRKIVSLLTLLRTHYLYISNNVQTIIIASYLHQSIASSTIVSLLTLLRIYVTMYRPM